MHRFIWNKCHYNKTTDKKKWQIDNIKGNEAEARSQKVQMIDIEMALILNTLREEVSNNNKIEWRPKKKRTKPTVAIENLRLSNGIFLAIQYNDRTTKKTESKKKPKCKRHLTKMYCQRPVDLERWKMFEILSFSMFSQFQPFLFTRIVFFYNALLLISRPLFSFRKFFHFFLALHSPVFGAIHIANNTFCQIVLCFQLFKCMKFNGKMNCILASNVVSPCSYSEQKEWEKIRSKKRRHRIGRISITHVQWERTV